MALTLDPVLQEGVNAFLGSASRGVAQAGDGEPCESEGSVAVLTGASSGQLVSRLRSSGFASIHEFALLPSAKKTRWIIPIGMSRCTSSSFNIYAPYRMTARTLKRVLLAAAEMGWAGWARHRMVIGSRRPLSLESLVSEIVGEPRPVFALSLGTPGCFRKLTIQVMTNGGDVLGYLKLPMARDSFERVRHEAATLQYLSKFPALQTQIPRVLYAGEWDGGYILFESAGPSRPAPGEFGALHQEFLMKLWDIHCVQKPGETLVEETARRWKRAEHYLDVEWHGLGAAALKTASNDLRRLNVRCGISHGDFAPWNTRFSGGRLFTFDWESAQMLAPNQWDVFHFNAQASSLLGRKTSRQFTLGRARGERGLHLLYLLESVNRCLAEKTPDNQIALSYRFRGLLEELSS